MDYTQFTTIKNRLASSPNLCDLFKLLSIETWTRMEYAYIKPRVKVFETTITQNLIFTINAYADQYGLDIEVFEAKDENTNGNDLELIIRYPSEGLEYYAPIQAKKVYRNGRYTSMDHGDQIKTLIDYAKLNKAKPYYLLYNYDTASLVSPFAAESYGCTLISAEYLFNNFYAKRESTDMYGVKTMKWLIPSFDNLNPSKAFSWQDLVCSNRVSDLLEFLSDKDILPKIKLPRGTEISNINMVNNGLFQIGTLNSDNDWINIKSLTPRKFDEGVIAFKNAPQYGLTDNAEISRVNRNSELSENRKTITEKKYPNFAPKSRIVITKE